jgi:hypothetical protein
LEDGAVIEVKLRTTMKMRWDEMGWYDGWRREYFCRVLAWEGALLFFAGVLISFPTALVTSSESAPGRFGKILKQDRGSLDLLCYYSFGWRETACGIRGVWDSGFGI